MLLFSHAFLRSWFGSIFSSGVLGVEEPHQYIPNLVVKLNCGNDTVGEEKQLLARK